MLKKIPNNRNASLLNRQGYKIVAGVDEVGRGCLAGPVVAAAVVLPPRTKINGVNDSKLLTPLQRRRLSVQIKRRALAVGIGWTGPELIDRHGLTWAVRMAAKLALAELSVGYQAILLDGQHNYIDASCFVQTVIKGDSQCLNIAAASIIAKVARDNYMQTQHYLYPSYGFNRHVGYGTPQHLAALEQGLTPLHRRRFAPIERVLSGGFIQNMAGSSAGGIRVD